MIIVKSSIIPFRGYKAICLWPFIVVRKGKTVNWDDINHEKIHGRQQLEMLLVFFYLWYLVEWLVRLCMKGNAYKSISFEREAYEHECETDYLDSRKPYSWLKYLF